MEREIITVDCYGCGVAFRALEGSIAAQTELCNRCILAEDEAVAEQLERTADRYLQDRAEGPQDELG